MYNLILTDSERRVLLNRWTELVKKVSSSEDDGDRYDDEELQSILIKLQVSLPVKPHRRNK
jgi:hypothetical protein